MDRNDQWRRREWDGPPESVAVDEMGYQSSGALSDGPTFSAALLAEHGYNSNAMRSSSSVGSQGSGERHAAYFRQPIRDMLPYLMNGETRFPTAFYPASEAAKSDIATVCSGSITEDIEVASVLSADYNVAQIPNNLLPSPPSSERSARPGNRRTASGGRLPSSFGLSGVLARQSAMSQDSVVHDMGPPLSRALLLQHPHAQESSSSKPGSVRSFGSTAGAGSDNVAHLDTDDCGGSFTDGHSQEDNPTGMKDNDEETVEAQPKDDWNETHHPLRNGDSSNVPSNGRVSPGGTVYRGRGVRRYQGRYMNLPLKRFHQNGVNLCGDDSDMAANGFAQNNCYSRDDYTSYDNRGGGDRHEYNDERRGGRSKSPRARWNNEQHDRRRSPSPGRYNSNGNGRRMRSRSRSPPPSNGNRSRSPARRARRSSRSWRSRITSPSRYKSHRSRGGGERYSSRRNGDTNRNAQRSDTPPRYRRRHRNSGGRSSSR